jgi:hypothetical protein
MKLKIKYFLPEGLNKIIRRFLSSSYRKRRIDHKYEITNHNRTSLIIKGIFLFPLESVKYLEIGCFNNEVFDSVPLLKHQKVGVDPQKGGTLRLTSDAFFLKNKDIFNVIFIDGLHHYDQVRRDIINSINSINSNGIIFIHDMLPESEISSKVPRQKFASNWNGDVFRVIFDLLDNDNLVFKIVNIDFGVGIIMLKNNEKINLGENDFDYDHFIKNKSKLPIISLTEAFKLLELSVRP